MIMNIEDQRKYNVWIYFQLQASNISYLTSTIKNDKTKRKH